MPRRVEVQLVGDSRSLERAFDRAGRKGEQFQTSMGRMGSSLKTLAKGGLIGAAVGGTALLTSQLIKSVGAAKEAEAAQARLEAAFKSSGKSYKAYGKQLDNAIQKTSKLAAIDDEELSDAFAKLLRTTGSVKKATEGMALAADIARARNISLAQATNIVEKAHVGQLRGLKGVGVAIETGTTATEALERAQTKFAGSAERYGKTAVAANERLAVAWENVQEKLGQKMLPALVKVSETLIKLIDWGERNWPRFSKFVEDAWSRIRPVFEAFKSYFSGWVTLIQGIVEGDWSKVWAGLKQVVVSGFKLVFEYLKAVPAKMLGFGLEIGKELGKGILQGLFVTLPKKILNAILPGNPFGGGGSEKPSGSGTSATYGGPRARGGPVSPGRSYVVGERGPEIFTPSRAGNIATGGGGITLINPQFYGVSDPQKFLAELQRLARMAGSQGRGHYGGQSLALN